MNSYISITAYAGTPTKRFKVLMQEYGDKISRDESIRKTINGILDVQRGRPYRVLTMILKVPYTPESSDWGDKDDLDTFVKAMPPADKLTLTDFAGTTVEGFILTDYEPQLQTPTTDSSGSFWLIPIVFHSAEPIA